jgi:hypothetical protein
MSEISGHLDTQQAMLVERLRAAGGAAVTFEELRGIGIENPALLSYELAAVGLPITSTSAPAEGMPALSVRLEQGLDGPPAGEGPLDAVEAVPQTGAPGPPPRPALAVGGATMLGGARTGVTRLGRSMRPGAARAAALAVQLWRSAPRPHLGSLEPRVLTALASLVAVFAVAVAIVLGHLAHRPPPSAGAARGAAQRPPESSRSGPPEQGTPAPSQPQPARPAASAVVAAAAQPQPTAADAVSLESEGHQLLAEGSYARAIGTLASAVRASGQAPSRCSEPASEACLTLAYALYDLGRALRLDGRQPEAIAVLSERLSIDNQRATVQHELDLARGARA